jgi:hypothetical protein
MPTASIEEVAMRSFVLSLLAAGSLIGAGALPATAAVVVSGQVVSRTSHAAVGGLTVEIYREKGTVLDVTTSLANGSFVLRVPAAGAYTLSITGKSIVPLIQGLDVPADGKTGLSLEVGVQRVLQLKLVGPDGKPVVEGPVNVTEQLSVERHQGGMTMSQSYSTSTQIQPGADGILSLTCPPDWNQGNVHISITVSTGDQVASVKMDSWPTTPVEVKLGQAAILAGKVVDAQGKPVAGTLVSAAVIAQAGTGNSPDMPLPGPMAYGRARSWRLLPPVKTDAEGKFEFSGLVPGASIQLSVTIPGAGVRSHTVTLKDNRTDVTLSPADKQGAPGLLPLPPIQMRPLLPRRHMPAPMAGAQAA